MKIKSRHSYGIMLFRKNPITDKPELFLMQHRCTYEFMDFAHANYSVYFTNRALLIEYLRKLFCKMTLTELDIIRTMDFNFIWTHMWKHFVNSSEEINKLKTMSINNFNRLLNILSADTFVNLIKSSTTPAELWWEPPKGKQKKGECRCRTAIREFEEETGISKHYYVLIPQYEFRYSYIENNMNYVITYYLGIANKKLNKYISNNGSIVMPNIVDHYTEGSAFKFMEKNAYKNILYSSCKKLLLIQIKKAATMFSKYRRGLSLDKSKSIIK